MKDMGLHALTGHTLHTAGSWGDQPISTSYYHHDMGKSFSLLSVCREERWDKMTVLTPF